MAFEKYGLTIHPEKTRLVPFERPDRVPDRTGPERRDPPGEVRWRHWLSRRKRTTSATGENSLTWRTLCFFPLPRPPFRSRGIHRYRESTPPIRTATAYR